MTEIKSSHKLLLSYKDLRSRNVWQRNDGPLKFFGNLQGKYKLFKKYQSSVVTEMQYFDHSHIENLNRNF